MAKIIAMIILVIMAGPLLCVYPEDRVNGARPKGGSLTPLFDRSSDWDREIKRTNAEEWRVCSINQGYAVSPRCSGF